MEGSDAADTDADVMKPSKRKAETANGAKNKNEKEGDGSTGSDDAKPVKKKHKKNDKDSVGAKTGRTRVPRGQTPPIQRRQRAACASRRRRSRPRWSP